MMAFCPNMDCDPGCGRPMAELLLEAMTQPLHATLKCPHCGTEMVSYSTTGF